MPAKPVEHKCVRLKGSSLHLVRRDLLSLIAVTSVASVVGSTRRSGASAKASGGVMPSVPSPAGITPSAIRRNSRSKSPHPRRSRRGAPVRLYTSLRVSSGTRMIRPTRWIARPNCASFSNARVRASILIVDRATQMRLVEHDQIVEALPLDGSDQSLDIWVLPRTARCSRTISNAHCSDAPLERFTVRPVAIAHEIARRRVPGKRFRDLPCEPLHG